MKAVRFERVTVATLRQGHAVPQAVVLAFIADQPWLFCRKVRFYPDTAASEVEAFLCAFAGIRDELKHRAEHGYPDRGQGLPVMVQ